MSPMDGVQWGITLLFMSIVFVIMETEKYIRMSISHQSGGITDNDAEKWIFDSDPKDAKKRRKSSLLHPNEVRQLGLMSSKS